MPLDEIDHSLLKALDNDGRATMVSLARATGLSRSATHDRLVRLEERGIVIGYRAIVDADKAGFIEAVMTVALQSGHDNEAIADALVQVDGVRRAHCVTGEQDIILFTRTSSTAALNALRQRVADATGVDRVATHTIIATRQAARR